MPATFAGQWLRRFLDACVRLAAGLLGRESAWDRVRMPIPASVFGPGSRRSFPEYFQGSSRVHVGSIDDIVAFLQTCEYASDNELFHEPDVWQHPSAFEERRRGDCEDFALWAWRKLAELGIDAEFCVGRVICDDRPRVDRQHAWVVYRLNGAQFLFEPAARTPSKMIRPFADAMAEYVPHFSANDQFDTCAFSGCCLDSPFHSPI